MRVGRVGAAAAGGLVVVVAGLAALTPLGDWDTFHHLAYGRELVSLGGFPAEDPFLFPLAGTPAGPQPSWLGSVLIYGSWRLLGDLGPIALAVLLSAAIFLVLWRDAVGEDDRLETLLAALAPLALALALFRVRAVARPELPASLLLVALLHALRIGAGWGWRWAAILALGIPLWANVHQSVLAGLGVVGLYLAVNGALLALGRRDRAEVEEPTQLVPIAAGAVAGIALCGLTPVGFAPFHTPLVVVDWVRASLGAAPPPAAGAPGGTAAFQQAVGELQPMGAGWRGPFGALVAVAGAASLLAWRRARLRELLTCLAFVALASRLVRFGAMAAVVLAPVAVRAVRAALDRVPARLSRAAWLVPAASVAAAAWVSAAAVTRTDVEAGVGHDRRLPLRAVDYLRAIGFRGRLFDTFHFGGLLEWMLRVPVYQDGRGGVPAGELEAALLGPGFPRAFEALDARWRFDALVVQYRTWDESSAPAGRSAGDWGADPRTWALVAFDDGGQVFLRRDGAHAAEAQRDEFRFARPGTPLDLAARDGDDAVADWTRALREAPGCRRCSLYLGTLHLEAGRLDLAQPLLEAARAAAGVTGLQATYGLARVAAGRGRLGEAEARMRDVVAGAEDPVPHRRTLAELIAAQGRPKDALAALRASLERERPDAADLDLGIDLARQAGDARAAAELERRRAGAPR